MAEARPSVLGLKWRRFKNDRDEDEENQEAESPTTKGQQNIKKRPSASSIGSNAPKKMKAFGRRMSASVSQAVSSTSMGVMERFGSFRNKMRVSTRRRKRLFEIQSPYRTPLEQHMEETPPPPTSAQRRSARIAQRNVDMYSPFHIDTPSCPTPSPSARNPARIRMGTHTPKRFNFSSPGQLQKDLNTVEESLKELNDLSEALAGAGKSTPRSRIRTTPGGRKTPSKRRPVFI